MERPARGRDRHWLSCFPPPLPIARGASPPAHHPRLGSVCGVHMRPLWTPPRRCELRLLPPPTDRPLPQRAKQPAGVVGGGVGRESAGPVCTTRKGPRQGLERSCNWTPSASVTTRVPVASSIATIDSREQKAHWESEKAAKERARAVTDRIGIGRTSQRTRIGLGSNKYSSY